MAELIRLKLKDLHRADRLRPVDMDIAAAIGASFEARGQISPIPIRRTSAKNKGSTPFTLIAGGNLGASTAQNVVDGAASFDYNTGAILKASWVGKVLKGLVRRRAEEADIIILSQFLAWVHAPAVPTVEVTAYATYVVSVTDDECADLRAAFAALPSRPSG
jgi:hypothetical protein